MRNPNPTLLFSQWRAAEHLASVAERELRDRTVNSLNGIGEPAPREQWAHAASLRHEAEMLFELAKVEAAAVRQEAMRIRNELQTRRGTHLRRRL